MRLDIAIFGLSITSAWGNGHATTYRALAQALTARGHRVRFFERDRPWYAASRDLPDPPYADTVLYESLADLEPRLREGLGADLIILGSYVPEGVRLAHRLLERREGLVAFYDIDTPVTLASLERGACEYLEPALIPRFDLYLSFAGGPILGELRRRYGARLAQPLYCSVDPRAYRPLAVPRHYDLGFVGTYTPDRQPALEQLLLEPARRRPAGRFSLAGAQYPSELEWPANVERVEHLPPGAHCVHYNAHRFTLNVTRADMVASGHSPSVRLFEAAACGVPIISDPWPGLEEFFVPGAEILVARTPQEVLGYLYGLPEAERVSIARKARARVLAAHTAEHRAICLERYYREARVEPFAAASPRARAPARREA